MIIKKPLRIKVLQIIPGVLVILASSFAVTLNIPSISSAAPWQTNGWDKISSGNNGTCGISAGRVYCWGDTGGVNSLVPRAVDTTGVLSGKTATDVSVGVGHVCVVASGQAYCWGNNNNGQVGDGTTNHSNVPVAVDTSGALHGKTVTAIAAANAWSCAIADGQAYCWGDNQQGNLGDGTTAESHVPVAVSTSGALSGKTTTKISAKYSLTCVIAEGNPYCWGAITGGSPSISQVPVAVDTSGVLSGKTITAISAEGIFSACVIADGQAYCWGNGTGNGTSTQFSSPVAVDTSGVLSGKTIANVSVGSDGTCVTATDGRVYCWGKDDYGQLGDGSNVNSLSPVAVDTSGVLSGKTVTSISYGGSHVCAIADTEGFCWGVGVSGQLGNRSTTLSVNLPSAILGSPHPIITSLSPSSAFQGDTIAINGSGFDQSASVTIDNKPAVVLSRTDSVLQVVVPDSTAHGPVDVTVINEDGEQSSATGAFTYLQITPQIDSTSPSQGTSLLEGGGDYWIYGSNFDLGAVVRFGTLEAQIQNINSTYIQVKIPAAVQTGSVPVTVTNPNGAVGTAPNPFVYVTSLYLDNKYLKQFGSTGTGDGQFDYPEGIAIAPNGNIFVTDSSSDKVQVFTSAGTYIRQFGSTGTAAGQFDYPSAIDIGPDGNVYVVDTNNSRVEVFNQDGQYIYQFGSNGFGNGQFGYAEGLAINSQGNVYVSECGYDNNANQSYSRVHVFRSDGTFLRSFGSDGTGDGEFDCTYGLAIDKNDNVYVADANNYRIQVFDKNDNFIRRFGTHGIGEGQFGWIEDLTIDGSGNVLVTDSDNDRIQVFSQAGAYRGQIGRNGTGNGQFNYPNSIAIGLGGELYITDARNNRVQVFEGMSQASIPVNNPISTPATTPVPSKNTKKTVSEDPVVATDTTKTEIEQSITINGETPLTGEPTITKRPTFSGIAAPFAEIVITIHSDPVVCKTTADAEGKWSCTLDRDLAAGNHHVTIELTKQDGTKTMLGPYAVVVKGGDTINSDSKSVSGKKDSNTAKNNQPNDTLRNVVFVALAVIGIISAIILIRRKTVPR